MQYTPYTSVAAEQANNRVNESVKIQDSLKNSASTRRYQDVQGKAAATNAAANMLQASASASAAQGELALKAAALDQQGQMHADEMSLKEAALGEERRRTDMNYGLESERLGLDTQRVNMEAQMLGPKLEGMNLQNDAQRLQFANGLLEFEMNKAMQAGNLERIPRLFALKDMAMDAQELDFNAHKSLQKWGVLAQYSSGIATALEGGRTMDAQILRDAMIKDLEESEIDVSSFPFLQAPLSTDAVNTWKSFSEMAISSQDFRQKAILAQLQNGSSSATTLMKLLELQLKGERNDRADADQNIQEADVLDERVGLTLAERFGFPTNANGAFKPSGFAQAEAAGADSFGSLKQAIKAAVRGPDGGFRPGVTMDTVNSISELVSSKLQPIDIDPIGPGNDLGPFVLQPQGILPNESGGIMFQDPQEEILAVANDSRFKSEVIPAMERFSEMLSGNPQLQGWTKGVLQELNKATDPMKRARMFEHFVHLLTVKQVTQ